MANVMLIKNNCNMIILMILVEIYFISHLLKAVWKEIEFECRYAACSSQFLTKKSIQIPDNCVHEFRE